MDHVPGFGGEDTGVLELDAVPRIDALLRHIGLSPNYMALVTAMRTSDPTWISRVCRLSSVVVFNLFFFLFAYPQI
jgi:hypothetical protein